MTQTRTPATTPASRPARSPVPRVASLAVLLLLAAGGASAGNRPAIHDYTVSVDAELRRLTVEARFDGAVNSVAARSRRAGRYLQSFRNCEHDTDIRMRNRRLILPVAGIRCMSYSVDLAAAAKAERRNEDLAPGNLLLSPSVWLWRPEVNESSELRVTFELPDGIGVAVPWEPLDTRGNLYRVARSPESASASAAFGAFERRDIRVPGATLRVSLMRGKESMDSGALLRWVEAAATDVSLAYGHFPNPSPQVVVIPVADSRNSDSAVPYGRVVRDGGESVELFVNQDQPLRAFLDDWTATHEFSHLMLPYVGRNHRWISEGFAQYYQNILLARSGAYDRQRAWQKIYEGLERGRLSRPELSPNDAAAGGTREGLMKVYWSGAAIALMADVALREQSGGRETLDDVLARLQSCCLPSGHVWTGPELFATLDDLAGRNIFMPLYRRYADTIGFPDTSPVFARLGLRVDDGMVRIERSARLDHIRNAITEVDVRTANWREQLAAYAP